MPRYVVEREFPDGLQIRVDETGAKSCLAVVDDNLADRVTWVHSYVSADKRKTFCVYDAPSPEAIRRTHDGDLGGPRHVRSSTGRKTGSVTVSLTR